MNEDMTFTGIFDSHAHYDDKAFDSDRFEMLGSLPQKGICNIINCGCSIRGSLASRDFAEKYDYVYFAAGIHPHDCTNTDFEEMKRVIPELLSHEKCVAVGEIGLDYHYDFSPRDEQKKFFEEQLRFAAEFDLPVIVHDREAHEDTMTLLKKYRPKGVLHCFSGGVEMMNEVLSLGMYIGIGGAVTFENAKRPRRIAQLVPQDRFLTETDCPYMTPVPHRGKRCDSSFIPFTAQKIAEERNSDAQTILNIAAENARTLFGIPSKK